MSVDSSGWMYGGGMKWNASTGTVSNPSLYNASAFGLEYYGLYVDSLHGYDMYFTDPFNGRIVQADALGTFVQNYPISGMNRKAGSVRIDMNQNIYIPDADNNRIIKYTHNGTFVSNFTTTPSTDGLYAMTLDTSGNMYLADWGGYRVVKLAPNGTTLHVFHATDAAPASGYPLVCDVSVDSLGHVYAAYAYGYYMSPVSGIIEWNEYGDLVGIYNSTGPGVIPYEIGLDGNGNVYMFAQTSNGAAVFVYGAGAATNTSIEITTQPPTSNTTAPITTTAPTTSTSTTSAPTTSSSTSTPTPTPTTSSNATPAPTSSTNPTATPTTSTTSSPTPAAPTNNTNTTTMLPTPTPTPTFGASGPTPIPTVTPTSTPTPTSKPANTTSAAVPHSHVDVLYVVVGLVVMALTG